MEAQSTPTVDRWKNIIRFVAYTAIMFVSFNHDFFQIAGDWRHSYIGYDSYLVLTRMRLAQEGAPLAFPMCSESMAAPYLSQVGLQGVALGAALKVTHLPAVPFAVGCAALFSLATAGLLGLFFVSISRLFDSMTATIGVLLMALSPHLLPFAPSLYWSVPLLLAPFVLTWVTYPWLRERRFGYLALAAMIFGCVAAKALCGYEYITTVVLSPVPALFFHEMRARALTWRRLARIAGIVVVSGAGFAAAMGMHMAQIQTMIHRDPIATIRERAAARTMSDGSAGSAVSKAFQENPQQFDHPILTKLPTRISYPVNCFLAFFRQPAFVLPRYVGVVRVFHICVFLMAVGAVALVRRRSGDTMRALLATVVIGCATSLSWQVMALNHMCVHSHLNLIVFFVPFLPLAYVVIGKTVGNLVTLIGAQTHSDWIARGALAGTVGLMAMIGILHPRSTLPTMPTLDRIQAAKNDDAMLCCFAVERQLRSVEHPQATFELDRSILVDRSEHFVVNGWSAPATSRPQDPRRFVLLRGDQIEPLPAEFVDRADVDFLLKRHVVQSGFRVKIPTSYWNAEPPPRLFMVAGRHAESVRELAIDVPH